MLHGGRSRLHAPEGPLDCGNSGTSMRLLAGLVAGLPWGTELIGDESLSARPMDRVAEPLGLMGADGARPGRALPAAAHVAGRRAARHRLDSKVASAQVKSAILLAGLSAARRDRGARGRDHPDPHRGDAGRGGRRRDRRAVGRGPGGDASGASTLRPVERDRAR